MLIVLGQPFRKLPSSQISGNFKFGTLSIQVPKFWQLRSSCTYKMVLIISREWLKGELNSWCKSTLDFCKWVTCEVLTSICKWDRRNEATAAIIFLTFLSDFTVMTELPNLDCSCKIMLLVIILFLKWIFFFNFLQQIVFHLLTSGEISTYCAWREEKKKVSGEKRTRRIKAQCNNPGS